MDQDLGLATFCVTATGRVRMWSPSAAALFGKERDEILGRDLCEAVLDCEHREALDAAMRRRRRVRLFAAGAAGRAHRCSCDKPSTR